VRTLDQDGKVAQLDTGGEFYTYGYDDAMRITSVTNASSAQRSWTYGYDNLDRLTSAVSPPRNSNWTYDASGNRLSETSTVPATTSNTFAVAPTSNRLTSISGSRSSTHGYDNAGNVTSETNSGRPISLASTTTSTYLYNALGQRIAKSMDGTATYFVYDEAGHLLGEYGSGGALIQETVWLGDTPVATLRPKQGGGVEVFYLHTDHLNAPRKITRASDGTLMWRWDPGAFGDTLPDENPQLAGSFRYNLRFPGQYYDAESGLSYNYFRDYDSYTGRYLESDPIGLVGGIATYAYGFSNPLTYDDPFGLRPPTPEEEQFIQRFFGNCISPKTLDIKMRRFGNTSRALSLGGGFMSFPKTDFVDGSADKRLKVDIPYNASIFGHELLHQLQRSAGVNVTGRGLGLQLQYSLHISDPYRYDASITDPDAMLKQFKEANVESQGQIFQDYLYRLLTGQDASAYAKIAELVREKCLCSK
jgi:RHS repeat-associated protein